MPRIADYSVVTDVWVHETPGGSVTFQVGSNIDAGSQSVLSFMLQVDNDASLDVDLRLNGISVWKWHFPDGNRFRFIQEVITPGVVRPGANVLSFTSSSGDFRMVRVSDVVLWWQANI